MKTPIIFLKSALLFASIISTKCVFFTEISSLNISFMISEYFLFSSKTFLIILEEMNCSTVFLSIIPSLSSNISMKSTIFCKEFPFYFKKIHKNIEILWKFMNFTCNFLQNLWKSLNLNCCPNFLKPKKASLFKNSLSSMLKSSFSMISMRFSLRILMKFPLISLNSSGGKLLWGFLLVFFSRFLDKLLETSLFSSWIISETAVWTLMRFFPGINPLFSIYSR